MDAAATRLWVESEFDVPRETMAKLDAFIRLLADENQRQNLVAKSTIGDVWRRHIADSAQLVRFDPASNKPWLDLGTGAGFPGLVVALLRPGTTILVEQRRLRADFLRRAAASLDLQSRVEVFCGRVERLYARQYAVISARAFAPLGELLILAERFSTTNTRWVLPKGRNAQSELEAVRASWQGDFRLEPSLTDPDARIIVADGVRRRERKRP